MQKGLILALIVAATAVLVGGVYYSGAKKTGHSELDDSKFFNNIPSKNECVIGGCNGELCLDKEANDKGVASICLYKPEFACYKSAKCEKQANGKCGWTQTSELKACLSNPPTY